MVDVVGVDGEMRWWGMSTAVTLAGWRERLTTVARARRSGAEVDAIRSELGRSFRGAVKSLFTDGEQLSSGRALWLRLQACIMGKTLDPA